MVAAFTHDPGPVLSYGVDRTGGLGEDVTQMVGASASAPS